MLSSESSFPTIAHPLGALDPMQPNSVSAFDPFSAPLSFNSSASAVAFVDGGLSNYQTLVAGVSPGTAVYVLNPNGDELSQISQVLAGYKNLSSVSVFSHGSDGALQLGHTSLNGDNLVNSECYNPGLVPSARRGIFCYLAVMWQPMPQDRALSARLRH